MAGGVAQPEAADAPERVATGAVTVAAGHPTPPSAHPRSRMARTSRWGAAALAAPDAAASAAHAAALAAALSAAAAAAAAASAAAVPCGQFRCGRGGLVEEVCRRKTAKRREGDEQGLVVGIAPSSAMPACHV